MRDTRDEKSVIIPQWKLPAAILLFLLIGFLALTLPDHPDAIVAAAFAHLPVELPLAGLVLLFLPRYFVRPVATPLTLAVFTILFLKLADIGTQAAFQRPFNPYLDLKMMVDGWNLFSGTVGTVPAALVVAAALFALVVLFAAFFWSLRHMALAAGAGRRWLRGGLALVTLTGLGLISLQPTTNPIADIRAGGYLVARLDLIVRSIDDMRAFEAELAKEEGPRDGAGLFQTLAGRDVVLIFVESYGRSAVEDPRYSGIVRPRLEGIGKQLDAAGLASASGWLRSPTVSGLSWLAHGTFLSGLWIDSQARYDRLMMSERPTLNRLFGQAGWQSLAVMPAITMDWPEARYYGYSQVFAAADLGYRGKPFNWVTMPDQYTLSAFERLARAPNHAAGKPVMAEMALVSSHAPWTPVARLVDWNAVGDGRIFDAQAESGQSPAVVWADPENVRRHYIATIDYSLETIGDYMARFGRNTLFIVLGDHQPAAIVTGQNASRDVPVHIVSADAALVERFKSAGFSAGMIPQPEAQERLMSEMRGLLIDLFGKPVHM